MRENIRKMFKQGGDEDCFEDFDVKYSKVEKPIVNTLIKEYNVEINKLFFIPEFPTEEALDNDHKYKYHQYILSIEPYGKIDLRNIEKIMHIQITCKELNN